MRCADSERSPRLSALALTRVTRPSSTSGASSRSAKIRAAPALFLLTEALAALRQTHPTLHPRLQILPFQHIFRRLDDGDFDAVIGFCEETRDRITYHPLADIPLVCLCPADHPLASAASLTLADLETTPLVSITLPHITRSTAALQGQLMGERPPSAFYLADSCEAASALVDAGFGVCVLPAPLAADLPGIVRVPLTDAAPLSFGIYYCGDPGERPLLDALISALDACFA